MRADLFHVDKNKKEGRINITKLTVASGDSANAPKYQHFQGLSKSYPRNETSYNFQSEHYKKKSNTI